MQAKTETRAETISGVPDLKLSVRQTFGIDSDLEVPALLEAARSTCRSSIRTISSIARRRSPSSPASPSNRRVMVTGYHGTGKSTHIEQGGPLG